MELNLNDYYDKLGIAYEENNYQEMLDNLAIITRCSLKKIDFVYKCLYKLIKNNFHSEVKLLLDKLFVFKKDKIKFDILQNAIKNQENYQSLTTEQQGVYRTAISYGHYYYETRDLLMAYNIYEWGYYITEQPIFLYYIGKMLFKNKNYQEAEIYLRKYVKVGDSKLSKAYLYILALEKIKRRYNEAKRYTVYVSEANKLYGEDFEIEEIYTKDDIDNIDILKLKLQNRDLRKKRTAN